MNNPLVSVIIPTYNEERDIAHCLGSLKEQSYQPLEILVVDDGSKDKTMKVVQRERGIKLVRNDHLGPGAARNKGVKRAKGEILVFVDADMIFDNRFIDKLTLPIRKAETIGTFSKEEYVANPNDRWARCWSINRGWKEGRMHPKDYPDTQKVFRAIRKDVFEKVGGFDTKVGYTDDWTLADKLGQEARAAPGAIFYHRNPDNLNEAFKQSRWMAMRPYKLGLLGSVFAMLRMTLPISLMVGTVKAVKHRSPAFLLFKIVVDLAAMLGIIGLMLRKSRVK